MTDDWYGPDTATFGDRLAGAREAAGMNQSQLARRLGVKKVTLSGWEADTSEPRANRLSMLAGLLNVSISWLLVGEGDGPEAPTTPLEDSADLNRVLDDLRVLTTDLRRTTDKVALLEKRVRLLVRGQE